MVRKSAAAIAISLVLLTVVGTRAFCTSIAGPTTGIQDLQVAQDLAFLAFDNDLSEGRVVAFRAGTGKVVWRRDLANVRVEGRLAACDCCLGVLNGWGGAYVLDPVTGSTKAHLWADRPLDQMLCNGNLIVLVNVDRSWNVHVRAFDVTNYRLAWESTLSRLQLQSMRFNKDSLDLLVSAPSGPPRMFEMITLAADTGLVLSRKPTKRPPDNELTLGSLPSAVRNLLKQLFPIKEKHPYFTETTIRRTGDCWYIGKRDYVTGVGRVFAFAGSKPVLLWKKDFPHLADIRMFKTALLIANYKRPTGIRLTAVEAATGRPLWSTNVKY